MKSFRYYLAWLCLVVILGGCSSTLSEPTNSQDFFSPHQYEYKDLWKAEIVFSSYTSSAFSHFLDNNKEKKFFFVTQNGKYHIVFDCIERKSGCSENEKQAANERCELSFAYPCLLFAGRDSLLISRLNNFMTVYSPTVYNRFGLFFVESHDHKLVSGIGDIKFSKHGAKRFEEFAGAFNENALYLAFRKNGSNTTVVGDCHSEVCTLEEHLENIKICKRNTPAITCILFATQQNIIWTYHGNFMPYKSEVVRKRYGSYFLIPTI